MRDSRWRTLAALALVSAVGLAGCGSGGGAASSGTSGGANVAELTKIVKPYTVGPKSVFPTEPVGKPIPAGKSLVFINCGVPACQTHYEMLKEAGAVLGWKVTNITVKATPELIQAGFEQALRLRPDGVVQVGFSTSQFPRQAAELKAAGIPLIGVATTDETGKNGVTLKIIGSEEQAKAAVLLADQALIDAGGKGEFLSVLLSGYPILEAPFKSWQQEIKDKCPGCKQHELTIQPTALGTTAASDLANYLRAHPGIKGVFMTYDLMGQGLRQAVASTGGTYPNTYSWAPDAPGLQDLASGDRTAASPLDYRGSEWQVVDAFARLFTGQSIKPDDGWQQPVIWSKKYGNVPTPPDKVPVIVDNYEEQYKQLWGK